MAKRHLGLGKALKNNKKAKTVEDAVKDEEKHDQGQLTVELAEEADADDDLGQLKALWNTYADGDRDNELMVNGVIHECDRILRAHDNAENTDRIELPDYFHAIYGQALAELAKFHSDDNDKVDEYFKASIERLDLGLQAHPRLIAIQFAKARVLCEQLPLQYISRLTMDSEGDLLPTLDTALEWYEKAESQATIEANYAVFDDHTLEILQIVDDTLEIVDNFGKAQHDEEDGDAHDDEEEDEDEIPELPMTHPLYNIRAMDKYNNWWREHTVKFMLMVEHQLHGDGIKIDENEVPKPELLKKHAKRVALRRKLCGLLGQLYLQEAEFPLLVYTLLKYDDDHKDDKELDGLSLEKAQALAQELLKTAIKYLDWAVDDDDPETWVAVAEAKISLGNMYELDSPEQEQYYKEAETTLKRANNASNGKYQEILEGLLSKEDD
ncbi:hypothetical protein JNB11_00230 [Kocuria palustris]|nr:hypothetical protein [Kocuria palustris]